MYYLFFLEPQRLGFFGIAVPAVRFNLLFFKRKTKGFPLPSGAEGKSFAFLETKNPTNLPGFKINQLFTPSEYPSTKFLHPKQR